MVEQRSAGERNRPEYHGAAGDPSAEQDCGEPGLSAETADGQ